MSEESIMETMSQAMEDGNLYEVTDEEDTTHVLIIDVATANIESEKDALDLVNKEYHKEGLPKCHKIRQIIDNKALETVINPSDGK